jgi:hypothetical protein
MAMVDDDILVPGTRSKYSRAIEVPTMISELGCLAHLLPQVLLTVSRYVFGLVRQRDLATQQAWLRPYNFGPMQMFAGPF